MNIDEIKNQDDILEHALNFGIMSSAQRFNLPKEVVYKIVRKFKNEIELPCSCERAASQGVGMMCFMCDKVKRIDI